MRIPPAAWPGLVADPANRLAIDQRWLGYQVRRDGWHTTERVHDQHRLWLAVEGVASLRVDGRQLALGPGAALWLPPGVRFSCTWPALWRFHEVIFRLHPPADRWGLAGGAILVEGAWSVAAFIDRLADRAREPGRGTVLAHLLAAALAELVALAAAPPPRRGLEPGQRDRIGRVVRERIGERITPGDLARVCGLSPDYFTRRFRASFGTSPRAWLADERIRAAGRLIHDGEMTPAAAAEALGFADLPQFSRRFRAVFGLPPRRWRSG